jgi:glycosyltransferase involved in cell wall biosynthesis
MQRSCPEKRKAETETAYSIICVVPRGLKGKGGIERLFLQVDATGALPGMRFLTSRGDRSFLRSLGVFPRSIAQLIGMLALKRRAIVHINLSVQASAYRKLILSSIAKALGARVVVHFHGGGFDGWAHEPWTWVRVVHYTLRRADAVIALGDTWRDLFIKHGAPSERIHVVYNGIPDFAGGKDVPKADPGRGVRLLFAGEVGQRKGVDVLVEALAHLKAEANWTCTIAGNGQVDEYAGRLRRAGVSDRVHFTGWVHPDALHSLMLEADVVVLPSRAEALPMSLIEGAAAGAALIATDVGAVREIIDETCGIIIPCDAEALADAIKRLIDDRTFLSELQIGARRRYLERFTLDRMSSGLAAVYQSLGGR